MKFYITILIFISLIFSACEDPETKEYIVTGKVVYYQKSLEGVRLVFSRVYNKGIYELSDYIGTTECDSLGNFSFTYESDKLNPYMDVEISKNNVVLKSFEKLPFANNWNKELNVSDSAFVEFIFNSDNPLELGDTLYVGADIGLISYVGPMANGTRDTIAIRNRGLSIAWFTDLNNQSARVSVGYHPTGAPTIDVVQINYQNKH